MEGLSRPAFTFSTIDQIVLLEGPPRRILEIGGILEPNLFLSILEFSLCILIWLATHRLSRNDPSRAFVSTFTFQSGLTSVIKGLCVLLLLNGSDKGVFSLLFTLLSLIHRSSILLFPLCSSLLILTLAFVSKKRQIFCTCSSLYHLFSLLIFILLLLCYFLSDLLSSIPILIFHSLNATSPLLLLIIIIICLPIGCSPSPVPVDSRDKSIVDARAQFISTCVYVLPSLLISSLSYVSSISFLLHFLNEIPH